LQLHDAGVNNKLFTGFAWMCLIHRLRGFRMDKVIAARHRKAYLLQARVSWLIRAAMIEARRSEDYANGTAEVSSAVIVGVVRGDFR
jgi:hypothetical protein